MNEVETTALLERLGDQVTVGPPPLDQVLRTSKRARLRRRRVQGVAAVGAVAAMTIGWFALQPYAKPTALAPADPTTPASSLTPTGSPDTYCAQAFPGQTVSGIWTSVGALRSYRPGGPAGYQPFEGAFEGAPDAARAAWCWVRFDDASWTAYVVGPDGSKVRFVRMAGPSDGTDPTGPPVLK